MSNRQFQTHQAPAYYGAEQPPLSAQPQSLSRTNSRAISPPCSTSSTSAMRLNPSHTSLSSPPKAGKKHVSSSPSSSSSSSMLHEEHSDLPGPLPTSQALQPLTSRLAHSDSRSKTINSEDEVASTPSGLPRSASTRSLSYTIDAAKSQQLQRASSHVSSLHRCTDPSYPASHLALTLTKSENPDAIYIDWPLDDPQNPFNWPKLRKWVVVSTCFLFTACTAFDACGYPSASLPASQDLHTTQLIYLIGNTTYLFALSIAPMILAPLSEMYGRSPIYIAAAVLFTLMYIPQALAKNIATIIVARWFQGMAASVGNSMVAGSVSDLFHATDRGLPMSLYALSVYVAQGVSPYLSAVTVTRASWRIMFWWQGGLALLTTILMLIVLRETRGPVLLSRRARQLTRSTSKLHKCRADDEKLNFLVMVKVSLFRPMQYLISEPVVLSFAVWMGFLWGIIFISLEAIPIVFAEYGWNSEQQHLVLLTIAVGGSIGYCLNFHQEKLYAAAERRNGGRPPPEARLYYAAAGALLAPIGLFIFAWTGRPTIPAAAPIVGLVIFNLALFPVYLAVFSYVADVYERYASSAIAAQSFFRNALSSVFPLFSQQMYNNLTPKYASTLLAVIASVLGIVPYIFIRYGHRIRKHSRAAVALEREQAEAELFYQTLDEKRTRRNARHAAKLALSPPDSPPNTKKPLQTSSHPALVADASGVSTPSDSNPHLPESLPSSQHCEDCNSINKLPSTTIL